MAEKKDLQSTSQRHQETKSQSPEARGRQGISRRGTFPAAPWTASPFAMMNRFADEMERMFEGFGFGRRGLWPFSGRELWPQGFEEIQPDLWSPQIEILEREGKLIVRADLPGLKREDVKVELTEQELIIQGERRQEHKEDQEGFYRSERSYGRFYRSIPLPEGVDTDHVNATFRDGVLEISIPAPERAGRRRQVEIGEATPGEQPRAAAQTRSK